MTEIIIAAKDPRNPAIVHFRGVDGETLCGMPSRDLDSEHHRAISYDDGDSTCTRCNAYVQQTIDDATNDGGVSLIGDEYQPSAAITAMVAHTGQRMSDGQADNPLTSTYVRFSMLVVGIRAERPDWSDVQARDWLRAQLDQTPDAPPADLAAERFAGGGQLNGGIGHWSNH